MATATVTVAAPKKATTKKELAAEKFARLDKALDRLKKQHKEAQAAIDFLIQVGEQVDTKHGVVVCEARSSTNYADEYLVAQVKRCKKWNECSSSKLDATKVKKVAKDNDKIRAALAAAKTPTWVVKVRK